MIVIDRSLTDRERNEITGKKYIDLRKQADLSSNRFQMELLQWIDKMDEYTFNDQSALQYFSIGENSYWLHIRSRIFYELFNDAQLLDLVPDIDILQATDRIYCGFDNKDFWQRWAPQAEIIIEKEQGRQDKVIKFSKLWSRLKFAFRNMGKLPDLVAEKEWRSLCFSPMTNTQLKGELLLDKKLESLFMLHRDDWLRLEYQHLPKFKPLETSIEFFQHSRSQPTISTDLLIASYLIQHPHKLFNIILIKKELAKFKQPLSHSYQFNFGNRIWHKYLHQLIMRFTPSFLIFEFLSYTFEWLIKEIQPAYALATSETNSIGRIFIDKVQELNIPTFGIQHGIIAPHNIDYRFTPEEAKQAMPDFFFAWGNSTKDYLSKKNQFDSDNIFVVGQPESDLIGKVEPDPSLIDFKKNLNKPLLFFASQQQQNQKSRSETAKSLAKFCRDFDFCCAVKLHPAEQNDQLHINCFREHDIEGQLTITDGNLYSIINACDYGSTCYSTVAWEIMIEKKPLIIIDPLHLNLLKLSDYNSVLFVPTDKKHFNDWKEDLDNHIVKNYKMASDVLGPRDGNVAKRIDNIIRSLESKS